MIAKFGNDGEAPLKLMQEFGDVKGGIVVAESFTALNFQRGAVRAQQRDWRDA